MTLWAHPKAGSSQTLLPTLPFPLERVVGGEKVIILREGVGEDRVPKRDRGVGVSSFPSSSLCFFDPGVRWDKGSFFKFFTQAYLSLLYLVVISAKKNVRKMRSYNKERGNKRKQKVKTYFSHLGQFSSKQTQKAQVQGNTRISDEDQPARQSRQLWGWTQEQL